MKPRIVGLFACIARWDSRPLRRPAASADVNFRRIFTGNAFEAPPHMRHQRPRPHRRNQRRTLRALVLWLLQPSPFTSRHR